MNKMNSKRVTLQGISFDSIAESLRYSQLLLLERAGAIANLEVHPSFVLQEPFMYGGKRERAISYEADFSYTEENEQVVEDVKGYPTPVFKLKRKLFLARYGNKVDFRIIEV